MKDFIKRALGSGILDGLRSILTIKKFLFSEIRIRIVALINRNFGFKYLNIDAGRDAEMLKWWTGDYQTGFVFNEKTKLPFKPDSIKFAYSSMFFEHISDEVALNLLMEIRRVLEPGAILRMVVPNFDLYIQKYIEGDIDFFYDKKNENFATWQRLGVPLDLEHLFVGMISSIHNLPHVMVSFPFQEDFNKTPPRVCYPFQLRYEGYYCGPAPEITTPEIKEKIKSLSGNEFLRWVFEVTAKSTYQDLTFNTWHKNYWDLNKLSCYASKAGFKKTVTSEYGAFSRLLNGKIEKQGHSEIGSYFNLYK